MFNDPDHVPHGSMRHTAAAPLDVPEWEWAAHPILQRVVIEPDGAIAWQLGPCAPHVMEECVNTVSHVSFRRSGAGTLVARVDAPINHDWFVESDADDDAITSHTDRARDITRWYVRHDNDGAEIGLVCAQTIDGVRRYFEWVHGVWVRVPISRWASVRDGGVLEELTDAEARVDFPMAHGATRPVRLDGTPMSDEDAVLQTQLARAIAHSAHAAQVDKLDDPYVEHPARVAARFDPAEQPVEHAAAWLHDVIEDTSTTAAQLLAAGIEAEVVETVVLLTKDAALPHDEYYERIRGNERALAVKASDIADNTAPWRTSRLEPEDRERLAEKYEAASAALGLELAASGRSRRPVLYVDMDNTLVDFASAFPQVDPRMLRAYEDDCDDIPGIFAFMRPMPGAVEAIHTLSERYDIYVLSTAPWNNPSAWSDKVRWIQRHFGSEPGSVLYKRLILSHHKDLHRGAILVDDRPERNGAGDFEGIVVPFGYPRFPDWESVVDWLLKADVAA